MSRKDYGVFAGMMALAAATGFGGLLRTSGHDVPAESHHNGGTDRRKAGRNCTKRSRREMAKQSRRRNRS